MIVRVLQLLQDPDDHEQIRITLSAR